jgi:hypothetical protein
VPPEPGDPVPGIFTRQLELLEHDLVGLAQAMPGEAYAFRPAEGAFDGVRSFAEQVKHTATLIYVTASIVLEEQSPWRPGTNDNGPDAIQGKDQIIEYLERSIAYARRAMTSLSGSNHLDLLQTYFGPRSRAEIAGGIVYHSYNHYGQMVVYARMQGVVPPASRRQPA